ncbi:MAG: hypothetical protein WBA28_05355 [Microbacteriaceae bacterium]
METYVQRGSRFLIIAILAFLISLATITAMNMTSLGDGMDVGFFQMILESFAAALVAAGIPLVIWLALILLWDNRPALTAGKIFFRTVLVAIVVGIIAAIVGSGLGGELWAGALATVVLLTTLIFFLSLVIASALVLFAIWRPKVG